MGNIILLDENTANRIAAGEVVERPASAVKELVENALDAGAAQIVVTLEEGGKRRICVQDNGSGMDRDDAILALQRHATSKIRSADDLFAIRALGFRGEALPSIASVSQFVLTTKAPHEPAGHRLTVQGGDLTAIEEVGVRDGTTIEVRDLFYNTPARLKFLKSTPTELNRAVEIVGQLAAANPGVALRLRHGPEDRAAEVFATPGTGEPLAALVAVWGRDAARRLVPIRYESPGLEVSGFVATPDVSRPGRSHELFFVNRRPVRSRLMTHALEDAYRSLTPEGRYPIAAIFVDIAPDLVDVNVHPAKTEIKFTRDGEVHHAVSQAVKGALLAYGMVPTVSFEKGEGRREKGEGDAVGPQQMPLWTPREVTNLPAESDTRPSAPEADALSTEIANPLASMPDMETASPFTSSPPHLLTSSLPRPFAEQLRGFRVLGQARNTYIIAATADGIAFIDQHVAHERVLYERLTVKRKTQGISAQRLLTPLNLSLARAEALLLSERLEDFAASGWEIEPFGGDAFLVRAVPALLAKKPYEQILRDMVDELVHQSVARRLLVQRDHVTITNACKMAVKAGDPLTIEEMTALLDQLADTENPYMCPHGRPIVVTISFGELDRKFHRA